MISTGSLGRRTFLRRLAGLGASTAGLALLGGCERLPFQGRAKVSRIAYLTLGDLSEQTHVAFREGLRELGYVEGQTIAIEWRSAEGKPERLPLLAAELVSLPVELIVAPAAQVTAAVKNATSTIPIVFVVFGDAVAAGFAASVTRPGGNLTGLSTADAREVARRLALFKEAVTSISRVAVLWNPATPGKAPEFAEAQSAAASLALELASLEVRGAEDFDAALGAVTRGRADALFVLQDPVTVSRRAQIADFALKSRLPSMFAIREFVEAGGLMSYGLDRLELFRRAATYVDRILKGARPAELPVGQATKFDLAVNCKTAHELGLTIPAWVDAQVIGRIAC